MANLVKKARGQDKEAKAQLELFEKLYKGLADGHPVRSCPGLMMLTAACRRCSCSLPSRCCMPVMSMKVGCHRQCPDRGCRARAAAEGAGIVIVSAAIESEIIALEGDEKAEFLADLGLEEAGLRGLSVLAMTCLICSPSSLPARKRRGHGQSVTAPPHHRPQGSFILISSVALSAPRPLPMMIILPVMVNQGPKMLASSVLKAPNTSSRTATSSISASVYRFSVSRSGRGQLFSPCASL